MRARDHTLRDWINLVVPHAWMSLAHDRGHRFTVSGVSALIFEWSLRLAALVTFSFLLSRLFPQPSVWRLSLRFSQTAERVSTSGDPEARCRRVIRSVAWRVWQQCLLVGWRYPSDAVDIQLWAYACRAAPGTAKWLASG
jgi:hypothetical protein